jgi:hypothetical protein
MSQAKSYVLMIKAELEYHGISDSNHETFFRLTAEKYTIIISFLGREVTLKRINSLYFESKWPRMHSSTT